MTQHRCGNHARRPAGAMLVRKRNTAGVDAPLPKGLGGEGVARALGRQSLGGRDRGRRGHVVSGEVLRSPPPGTGRGVAAGCVCLMQQVWLAGLSHELRQNASCGRRRVPVSTAGSILRVPRRGALRVWRSAGPHHIIAWQRNSTACAASPPLGSVPVMPATRSSVGTRCRVAISAGRGGGWPASPAMLALPCGRGTWWN